MDKLPPAEVTAIRNQVSQLEAIDALGLAYFRSPEKLAELRALPITAVGKVLDRNGLTHLMPRTPDELMALKATLPAVPVAKPAEEKFDRAIFDKALEFEGT